MHHFAVPVMSSKDENYRWDIGDLQDESYTGIAFPHLVDTNREEPEVAQQTPETQTTSPARNRNQPAPLFQTASANNEILEKSEPVQESIPAYSRFNKLQKKFVNKIM